MWLGLIHTELFQTFSYQGEHLTKLRSNALWIISDVWLALAVLATWSYSSSSLIDLEYWPVNEGEPTHTPCYTQVTQSGKDFQT